MTTANDFTARETIGIDALLNVGITELTIPSSCTKFNLSGQKQLKKVTLPAGMTELPMNAFRRMTSLESVVLPAGITAIPSNLFSGCTSLKSLTIPEGVKTIGEAAFAESGIESIVIPESVEKIDDKTFQGCPNLESIDIKAPINSLPDFFAFECPNLKSVSLPEGLEEIGCLAFVYCSSLKKLSLPSTVKNIKYAAFAETGLESVSLPDGIEACKIALLQKSKGRLDANFIEGMACIGGCIGGADVIMLDNMAPEMMREAVEVIDHRAVVEASGGIDETTLAAAKLSILVSSVVAGGIGAAMFQVVKK